MVYLNLIHGQGNVKFDTYYLCGKKKPRKKQIGVHFTTFLIDIP